MAKMTDEMKINPLDRMFMRCQFGFESRLVWAHKGKYWPNLVACADHIYVGLLERLKVLMLFMHNHPECKLNIEQRGVCTAQKRREC